MKFLIQTFVAIGFANLAVSVFEFILYGKTSTALVLATLFLAVGFGGLFIYNRVTRKK
jgi:ABC-type Fe3+ transport system permease subunit